MKRPAGVTIAAAVVLVGSAMTLLSAAFIIFASAVMPAVGSAPAFTRDASLIMSVLMLGMAGWGIATGINLLQLREWARISMIIFSGLLLVMAVPGLLMMLVMPLPALPPDAFPPGDGVPSPEHLMTAVRVVMAVLYALLALLGGWWIYFFNSRPVRELFRGSGTAQSSAWAPAVLAPTEIPGMPKRPVSITIIAYLTLVGACMFPILNILHLPLTFLGFFFTGGKASLIVIGYMSVQLGMAYGLLKLEMWGRSLAIYYFNFAIFNSIISVILPGAQARYAEAMTVMQGSLGLPPTQFQVPLWTSLVFSLPMIAIQLWFVVTRKQAFVEAPHGPRASR
jgi:ABC-type antimicrobial peptide transport system permease subunit